MFKAWGKFEDNLTFKGGLSQNVLKKRDPGSSKEIVGCGLYEITLFQTSN